jgi:ribosomal protein L40E
MGFAKILVITLEGAAIALVAAYMYAITERKKTPSRDTQTSLKQFTTLITEPVAVKNDSTKFCSNCGTSLPLDSNFCIECGSKQL